MQNPSTCRILVGQVFSFCLNHWNIKRIQEVLVPRAGEPGCVIRAAAYFFKYLILQLHFVSNYSYISGVDKSAQRRLNASPRSGARRISCRMFYAYFLFYASLISKPTTQQLENIRGGSNEFQRSSAS